MARRGSGFVEVPIGAYAPDYKPGSKRRAREEARRKIIHMTPEEVEAKSLAEQKWAEDQIAKIMNRGNEKAAETGTGAEGGAA